MQVYELYPLAAGGPRAHRPAKQPSGKKADGWFYGRLTMSETLRVSGVPLKAEAGRGERRHRRRHRREGRGRRDRPGRRACNGFLDQMRRLFLLNGAVLVVILFGLAGIAFLIRRRV